MHTRSRRAAPLRACGQHSAACRPPEPSPWTGAGPGRTNDRRIPIPHGHVRISSIRNANHTCCRRSSQPERRPRAPAPTPVRRLAWARLSRYGVRGGLNRWICCDLGRRSPRDRVATTARTAAKAVVRAASATALRALGTDITDEVCAGSCVVVAPHPDDETLGCGATIARLRSAGVDVHVVFVTGGDASPAPPGVPAAQMVALRRGEARRALAALGVDEDRIVELGFADGEVTARADAVATAPRRGARRRRAGPGPGDLAGRPAPRPQRRRPRRPGPPPRGVRGPRRSTSTRSGSAFPRWPSPVAPAALLRPAARARAAGATGAPVSCAPRDSSTPSARADRGLRQPVAPPAGRLRRGLPRRARELRARRLTDAAAGGQPARRACCRAAPTAPCRSAT